MRREQHLDLLNNFIPRGVPVPRFPTPDPRAIGDVLGYLRDCELEVYPHPGTGSEAKFMFQGLVVTLRELASIADEHRTKRSLPPFRVLGLH
jgi:hypothetical protein